MLVSGGHSSLLRVADVTGYDGGVEPLGATIDDAAGEAFDKVARLLGLPFPGGPHIDRAARDGQVTIDFPRGLTSRRDLERHRFDFSFSGLKTAVARWVETQQRDGATIDVGDVAASFQEAVCDVLVRKALDAATDQGIDDILIGGGVAANSRLRAMADRARRGRRASGSGSRDPACAPTTARWWPPSAPSWSPAAVRRPPSTCPADSPSRSPRSSPDAVRLVGSRAAACGRTNGLAVVRRPSTGATAYSIEPSDAIRTSDHLPSW